MNLNHLRTLLAARRIGRYMCELEQYDRGTILPPHRHESAFMTVILTGGYRSTTQCATRDYIVHSLTVHSAGEMHSVAFGDVQTVILLIDGGTFERTATLASPTAKAISSKLLYEFRKPDEFSWMAIEALMLEACVWIDREPVHERAPSWLREVHGAIERRFCEPLSVRGLAESVNIHPGHLSREFHRHYGLTIVEKLRDLRVAHAKGLLASSMALQMIALDSGFADQSHFTRAFRRVTGTTPAQFRRSLSRRTSGREPREGSRARARRGVRSFAR